MEQFFIKKDTLEATAEAIRNKTGIKEKIKPADFPEKISEIEAGADVSGVTATRYDVLEGTKYVDSEGHLTYGLMENQGAVRIIMKPERSLAGISNGYHNGLGTILVNEGTETFTPTKEEQTYIAEGFYPKEIHIEPIPDQYKDVTNVTATASDVLMGKVIVDASGNEVEGEILNKEAINKSLTTRETTVTIPKGYYGEDSKVSVSYFTHRDAIPDKSTQTITGYSSFLKEVTVKPIPDKYQDVTPVTATAEDVRAGKVFVDAQGNPTEGTALIQTGMHLSIEDMVAPSELHQLWFRLNDTLYAAVGLSSSWEIYRYDDNSWVKVVDQMAVSLGHPSSSTYAIEHNGIVHFFAENKQNHYVFDGITLSQKLDLPNDTRSVCLHQEKIFNYMTDNCIYQWDEVADTWTLFIENVSRYGYFTHIFTANGFLYVKDYKILYAITDTGKEEVGNIPITATQLVVKDNTVVILGEGQYYNSPKRVYTYDLVTGISAFLGNLPTSAEFMYICEDGSIRGLIDNDCPSDKTNSFILEIRGTVATTNED